MTRERLALAAALSLVALPACAANPQDALQETRHLDISLRAEVEHDNNVAKTSDALAAQRGLTPEDVLFRPSVAIDFLAPVGRQSIFLRGDVGYTFYDKNKKLERENLDFAGGANVRFGPCRSTLGGAYTRGLNQVENGNVFEIVENVQETKTASLDLQCARETGLGVIVQASAVSSTNDLTAMRLNDYDATTVMAGVTYQRPALGMVTFFGSQTKTEYDNRPLSRGYNVQSIGATFERQLGARIQGTFTVAYATVDPIGPAAIAGDDFSTTTYGVAVTFRATERLRFRGTFDREVVPSDAVGRTYDLNTSYAISADYDLGKRIAFGLGFASIDQESSGVSTLPIIQMTDATTETMFASVRYRQSERLSFLLQATRQEQNTNAPQFDYTSNRIGLTADVRF